MVIVKYNASEISNAFIELAQNEDKRLSNMQLQKLVYIAFGLYAARINAPMFSDEIHAWNFGPVIPSLYHKLKKYSAEDILDLIPVKKTVTKFSKEMHIINEVWADYGSFSARKLSDLTHKADTPWRTVWQKERKNVIIPYDLIKSHFEKIISEKF